MRKQGGSFSIATLCTFTGRLIEVIVSISDPAAFERNERSLQQAIRRARVIPVGKTPVRYAWVEDLVVHKLVAGRPRDIEDLRGVLLKNAGLDAGYVRRGLREFEADAEESLVTRFHELLSRSKRENL